MKNWKGVVASLVAVAGAVVLIWCLEWVWVTWGPADQVDAFFVAGERVVVSERNHEGDEDPGGVRLVAIDAATGAVTKRVRADDRTLVGVIGGRAWFRTNTGLEARDLSTLEVVLSEQQLRSQLPALAPLTRYDVGCFDATSRTFRFVGDDGNNLAFDFATATLARTPDTNCASRDPLAYSAGRVTQVRVPSSQRAELQLDGTPLGISGLNMRFVPLDGALDGDVLVQRRASTSPDANTELARVDVIRKREKWVSVLWRRGGDLRRVELAGSALVVGDGMRMVALDLATGRELWRREP